MKRVIYTESAPKAVGPYSQGVAAGDFIFFSGQVPLDPATGKLVAGGISEQTRQVLKNVEALLESESLTAKNVVKATVFITDMNDFSAVNAEYAKYFTGNPPARSCVEVSKLPLDALVEIEIVAYRG